MATVPAPIQSVLPNDVEDRIGAQLVSEDLDCEGAKFHSPRPLVVHTVTLADGRVVSLCGTCRDAAVLIELVHHRDVSWSVMRAFGTRLRLLVTGSR